MKKPLTKTQELTARARASAQRFRMELTKSTSTVVVAALGFLIALSWKEVATEVMLKIFKISSFRSKIISATLITIISIAGILFISKINEKRANLRKESQKK